MTPGMPFGILGTLDVRGDDGRPIALGGVRQRELLAVLLLHPNEVVSVDRLIEDLCGQHPPPTAAHTIQVFVSRLRRALGPARTRVATRSPGYSLEVRAG